MMHFSKHIPVIKSQLTIDFFSNSFMLPGALPYYFIAWIITRQHCYFDVQMPKIWQMGISLNWILCHFNNTFIDIRRFT